MSFPKEYIIFPKDGFKGVKHLAKWRLVMNEETIRWSADKKKLSSSLKYRWLQKYVYVPKNLTKKQIEEYFNKPNKIKKHQLL